MDFPKWKTSEIKKQFSKGLKALYGTTLMAADEPESSLAPLVKEALDSFGLVRALLRHSVPRWLRWDSCPEYVALEYYLGDPDVNYGATDNLRAFIQARYQQVRYLCEYLWTLNILKVPGLRDHFQLLYQICPDRYGQFYLDPLCFPREGFLTTNDVYIERIAALERRIEDTDFNIPDLAFYQYTASKAIMKICEIAKNTLPECYNKMGKTFTREECFQPFMIASVKPMNDIWMLSGSGMVDLY